MDDTRHQTTWHIESTARAVSRLRATIRDEVRSWGSVLNDDQLSTLLLLSAELTSNALRYGDQEIIAVRIRLTSSAVSVRVTDGGQATGLVVARPSSTQAEDGRGLALVALLSTSWSVERTEYGKAVTAELALDANGPRSPTFECRGRSSVVSCASSHRTAAGVLVTR